jgi:Carboxypeptidase regulatory-like domain
VQQGRLRISGALVLTVACLSLTGTVSAGQSKLAPGKLAGVVNDTAGTPQMGATVEVVAESAGKIVKQDFLTNTQGIFRGDRLAPGFYTVRVTLAGFLPTLEQHVRISAHLTTVVRIQLESMFASLDELRHQPSPALVESDDWKWVLRSASATRPILQWNEDGTVASSVSFDAKRVSPKALLEFTDGARRPGSASNVPSTPATSFAYDQKLGGSRLLLAGEMNYLQDAPGGGIATVWLPSGSIEAGPRTTLVLREAKLGPDGRTFRGVRMSQTGAFAIGDRMLLRYGGEYVLVGLMKSASALRPNLELDTQVSENWRTALVFASQAGTPFPFDSNTDGAADAALSSVMNELDSLPGLLWRDGRPVLENGWHEEIAANRKFGSSGDVQLAAFHDDDRHVAVFGRGNGLPSDEYLQDYFSNAFAYDGGSSSSWGIRAAFRGRLSDDVDLTAIYAFAGALGPSAFTDGPLRDVLRTGMHHSLGANVSMKVPRAHTRVNVGYKWVTGMTVSRLDPYGESLFQMDPFLHVSVRQALPKFGPGRWEAIADCENLFAQGYAPLASQDGRTSVTPAFRSFRGGLSVQF